MIEFIMVAGISFAIGMGIRFALSHYRARQMANEFFIDLSKGAKK